jgi:acetate kinase
MSGAISLRLEMDQIMHALLSFSGNAVACCGGRFFLKVRRSDLLYHSSGLLGVSGVSDDMRTLLTSDDPHAAEAVSLFIYRIGRELGSLAASLGGLDAFVFTGGIGEHAPEIRRRACEQAGWLGVELDDAANTAGAARITMPGSKISAWVIPTNEDLMIARIRGV